MPYLFFIILFLLGAGVGSFLNVVIHRYDPAGKLLDLKNLGGRSRCPSCGRTLSAWELVPLLSFIVLGGKCKECRAPISLRYPLIEFLGGAIFVIVPLFLGGFFKVPLADVALFTAPRWYYGLFAAWIAVFLSWVVLWAIDRKHLVVPNGLNIFLGLLGIVVTAIVATHTSTIFPFRTSFLENYALVFSPFQTPVANHVLGSLAGGLFFVLLFLVSGGRGIGMGDVKLAFAAGLILGWPDIALSLLLSFVIGGAWGAFLYLSKKKTMTDRLAFGPFLVLGFFLTVFFGHAIVAGYFSMLGL